ncbi:hypothetical protein GW17_00050844 [Ensete ventricosum]|nr:hypothetical protein GW17_00050844 [Ensete ventricosum]
MEVEDIPQVHITSDFSCDHEVEKPREKEPPMKCSTSDDADPAPPMDGLFDCSICLDSAVDPVITLCGHLYCWPCIYKWMQVESISHHQCPVCKALLSEDTLIPLHGHDSHRIKRDSDVPCRPTFHLNRHRMLNHGASNTDEEYYSLYQPMQRPQVHHNYYHQDRSSPPTALSFHSRTGDVLGGLAASVLPWREPRELSPMVASKPAGLWIIDGNCVRSTDIVKSTDIVLGQSCFARCRRGFVVSRCLGRAEVVEVM